MRSNPRLGDDQVNREADPKGSAEEIVRRQAAEPRGGEEDAHNRANRGDGQPDGECTDHPFAMQRDLATANVDVGLPNREQKQNTEENRRGGLIDSADCGHGEAHHQGGRADNKTTDEKDSAHDAVRSEVARAKAGAELKWG